MSAEHRKAADAFQGLGHQLRLELDIVTVEELDGRAEP